MLRVGIILPSSNTTLEPDLAHALRGRATVHGARMHLDAPVTPAGRRRMITLAEPAARDLATLSPDLVLFGCTTASVVLGRARAAELRARLGTVAGAPVITVLGSVIAALERLRARRLALLTPYVPETTVKVAAELRDAGFDIVRAVSMGHDDNRVVGALEPASVVEAANRVAVEDTDALLIACTNLRALEARDEVAARIARPVVTSSSAAVDAISRALSLRP